MKEVTFDDPFQEELAKTNPESQWGVWCDSESVGTVLVDS